jgi:hypothetical protein
MIPHSMWIRVFQLDLEWIDPNKAVRTALYEAANVLLGRITRFSKLKRWVQMCQATRFKTGQGRLGAQDRADPASNVDRRHNLPVERSGMKGQPSYQIGASDDPHNVIFAQDRQAFDTMSLHQPHNLVVLPVVDGREA